MQITEIIPTIAELAVAIAGFSAVVVALRRKPLEEWSNYDRFNLRMLLQVGALTVFFSIFPFGALALLDPSQAWKVSIVLYGVVHLVDVSSFAVRMPAGTGPINRIASLFGISLALAKIAAGIATSSWEGSAILLRQTEYLRY